MRKWIAALLACLLCFGSGASAMQYVSDFSGGTDGWYPRSTGSAWLEVTEEGSIRIQGRSASWHSPGRMFELKPGCEYTLSCEVRQLDQDSAECMISVAHSSGGVESYENLARARVPKDTWTRLEGTWIAGSYDAYILYVETVGSGDLSYEIRNFTVTGEEEIQTVQDLPSLKEKYAGLFPFGTSVTGMEAASRERMDFYASQFGIYTPGNELKPDFVLDVAASREAAREDDTQVRIHLRSARPLLQDAMERGIPVHGHVLVWHSQTPEAFFREGYDTDRPRVSRDVMLARLSNYIQAVMEATTAEFPGVIISWDVVNEAVDDATGKLRASPWLDVVGEDYLLQAFALARKWAPEGVKLYYNDYNTAVPVKQAGILKVLGELMAEGNIDGYGFQMHHDLKFPSLAQIRTSLEKVRALGLRMRVSELDITVPDNSEESFRAQADMYGEIMKMLVEMRESMESVQVWGVMDSLSWRSSQYPLLFDGSGQPKPAFWRLVEIAEGVD